MLDLSLVKRLPGFTLDVAWDAGDEVVALFGPSGSGKSLTLQCLAGLVRPDAGRIVVNGRVLFDAGSGVDLPPEARRLGYVFQGFALFPHLTVEGNVGYGLKGRPAAARRRRVAEVLERLGLTGLERRRPRELSGGQQQRVALGRALAVDPELLLLDEPLSALDAPRRRELREQLARIVREFGKAAVLVTHDLGEAFQLADRVVVYESGRVVQAALKSEVLRRPASRRVARLMGVRNVLHGTVLEANRETIRIAWRGHALLAANTLPHPYLPSAGEPVAFFVRPEYVRLIRKDRPEPDPRHHTNRLPGVVIGEVDMGTNWRLKFAADGSGPHAEDGYDLEIEVPNMVYEMLAVRYDRRWEVSIQPGMLQVLPGDPTPRDPRGQVPPSPSGAAGAAPAPALQVEGSPGGDVMPTMKAVRVHRPGGLDALALEEIERPSPGRGEALVRLEAIGVNFIDVYHRTGLYKLPTPFVPGSEGAGVVEAVGEGVTEVRAGDRVAFAPHLGAYAQYAVVPSRKLVPLPAGVDTRQGAGVMLQGMTAHYLAHSTYPLEPGDTALVHAAAGGVGLLLVQIAKRRGARVLGTVSTEAKAKLAREAGADEVILYTEKDFVEEAKRLTGGAGVDVIYDSVGKDTFERGLDALRPRGYMVLYGQSSGPVSLFDLGRLATGGSLFVTRPTLVHYTATRAELLERAGDLFRWIGSGELTLRIERTYPLAEAAAAHDDLAARRTSGKLLLIP